MRKTPPIIRCSSFEEISFQPFKRRARGVCYSEGFWTDFLKDNIIKLQSLLTATFTLVSSHLHRWFVSLKRHYRKEFVVGAVLLLALIPSPPKVKALVTEPLYIQPVAHLEAVQVLDIPIPEPASVIPEEPVPEPVATPVAVPITGVTGCGDNTYKQFIYQHESGCRTDSINPIGACGLGQALPCSKMGCSLGDWVCQDAFFTSYMLGRYGSWEAAYGFWVANNYW